MFVLDPFEPKSWVMTIVTGRLLVLFRPHPSRRVIIQTGTVTAETQKPPAQFLKTQLESFSLIKPENYNVY